MDVGLGFERLESASFVGDVRVALGEQDLTAQRLDVVFRPDAGDQSLEELLQSATAWGQVRLSSDDGSVGCRAA